MLTGFVLFNGESWPPLGVSDKGEEDELLMIDNSGSKREKLCPGGGELLHPLLWIFILSYFAALDTIISAIFCVCFVF